MCSRASRLADAGIRSQWSHPCDLPIVHTLSVSPMMILSGRTCAPTQLGEHQGTPHDLCARSAAWVGFLSELSYFVFVLSNTVDSAKLRRRAKIGSLAHVRDLGPALG